MQNSDALKTPYFNIETIASVTGHNQSTDIRVDRVGHLCVPRGVICPKLTTDYVCLLWCVNGIYQDETEGEGLYTICPGEFGVALPGKTLSMFALQEKTEIRFVIFTGSRAVEELYKAGLWEGLFRDPEPPP
ncbi:MAG: hypothetical protein PHP44_01875 [Kiritimatiellae bacterium]|nr:hypothetical protein [Kiritimatiellia bacterium]